MRVPYLAVPRWARHPLVLVTTLGAMSWLAYLYFALSYPLPAMVAKYPLADLGRANNWSQASLADFIVSIFGPFILYLLAWLVVQHHSADRRLLGVILAFAALFAVTLLAMYPIAATDLFEYVFHNRILVHYGQNPLAVPPIAFKGDPFLKTVNWQPQASPYGPLWLILTVPGGTIAGNDLVLNLFLMDGLAVLFYLGCTVMVAAILRLENPRHQLAGTLLFAWNPLVLFEGPGNGHNDVIMMFFVLFAVYLLAKRQWLWVVPALVASVLVKYITAILLLPFLLVCLRAQTGRRARLVFLAKTVIVSALVILLMALPFPAVPAGLLYEANFSSLLALPTLAYNLLKTVIADPAAKLLTLGTGVAAYLILYAFSLRALAKDARPRRVLLVGTSLFLAYLGLAAMHFQPWFVVWPIALGIWIDNGFVRRVLLVFSVSALLSYVVNYFWIWNIRTWQPLQVNVFFVIVIFLPPLLVALLNQVRLARPFAPLRFTRIGWLDKFRFYRTNRVPE